MENYGENSKTIENTNIYINTPTATTATKTTGMAPTTTSKGGMSSQMLLSIPSSTGPRPEMEKFEDFSDDVYSNSNGRSERRAKKEMPGKSHVKFMELMKANKDVPPEELSRPLTLEQVSKHNKASDCWVVVHNKVYNVTPYLDYHPGGSKILAKFGGKDATKEFNKQHPWVNAGSILGKLQVGILNANCKGSGLTTSTYLQP